MAELRPSAHCSVKLPLMAPIPGDKEITHF